MRLFLHLFIICFFVSPLINCGSKRGVGFNRGANQEVNRCLKLSSKKRYQEAVECLEVFKSRYPSHQQAREADLWIADNYFRQKQYLVAAEAYQEFLKRHPLHPKADYAYYKSGRAYLKETPKAIDRDQTYLKVAQENFRMIGRYFPNSVYLDLATQAYEKTLLKEAKKHFYVGKFYYKYGEYQAAIPRFETIVRDFSSVGLEEKSFYYLILSALKIKEQALAIQAYSIFSQKYPESRWVKKLKGRFKKT